MISATAADRGLDDCWNSIGIQGDRSCPKLRTHIHCRNCEAYSAAARWLLDVPLPADHMAYWTKHVAEPRERREQRTQSFLILRTGAEWLALSTVLCKEVVSHRSIRMLPHRRSAAVLGIANVRGELIVCLSLAALLGIQPAADSNVPRLVIVDVDAAPTALHVDEVHGTHRCSPLDLARASAPSAPARSGADVSGTQIGATLRWRDLTVGVLDERALFAGITRSLV